MESTNQYPTDSEVENGKTVEQTNSVQKNQGENSTRIRIGKVDSLVIYEVSESELEIIERGSPNSTYLNFAIFLISICVSFVIAIVTCDFKDNDKLFYSFLIVSLVGGFIGIMLFIIWLRSTNDITTVIQKIRQRIVE